MKKLPQPVLKHLPPLTLYLDDIADVVSLLQTLSQQVYIFTDKHQYEDPSELSHEEGKKLRRLTITAVSGSVGITLTLGPSNVVLFLSDQSSPPELGVFYQVQDSFLKHKNHLVTALIWLSYLLIPISIGVVAFTITTHNLTQAFLIASVILSLCLFLCGVLIAILQKLFHTTIILKKRAEAPSWWERNWEKLLTLVIGIVLGWLSKFLPGPK